MGRDHAQQKGYLPGGGAAFNEGLLAVRSVLGRMFLPYAAALSPEHRPAADWFSYELVPSLVLLPGDGNCEGTRTLAAALELCFLAGRVHDLAAASGRVSGRAILTGDYLYSQGALQLSRAGYDGWLGDVGRLLCRRSEAMLARSGRSGRTFVPESEKILGLHKENAEAMALAAQMATESLDWPDAHKRAYAEFGFYLGILQGIVINGYDTGSREYADTLDLCRGSLAVRPALAEAAESFILAKFVRYNGSESRREDTIHQTAAK